MRVIRKAKLVTLLAVYRVCVDGNRVYCCGDSNGVTSKLGSGIPCAFAYGSSNEHPPLFFTRVQLIIHDVGLIKHAPRQPKVP